MDNGFAEGYAVGQGNSYGGGMGGFGWGMEWIWIIVLFALWGNGGWGGFGNNGGSMLSGILTRGDLCQDMNFNDLQNGVRNISDAVNVGFANLNSTICNQQYDTAQMINSMNISNLQSANALQSQLAQCCCDTQRAIDGVNYNMAQNTCQITNTLNSNARDIIASQQAGTQRILDYLCNEKISALQSENALLTSQLSQNAQTRTIIDTLLPVAKPAYITCSPYASAFGYPYATNSGCGCNNVNAF